ncbi:MAG: S-layer homology domain-containing protein, partial [Bifidobacteriaceae bacterium]|nr:S-layer homology domain-containing protein [Bifidobacteriaceae bacterium]
MERTIQYRKQTKTNKKICNLFIVLTLIFGISAIFGSDMSFANDKQIKPSLQAAPDAPKNVILSKIGKVLTVNWDLSNTPDVLYKVEIYNAIDNLALSSENLSSQTNSYTFSNVNTNFYKKAKVYAILDSESSSAESKGVYQQLYAINANNSFDDISALSDDAQRAINWQFVYGVAHGYTTQKYGPKNTVTREQMAAFLHRLAGSPKVYNLINPFVDVSQKNYFLPHILWALHSGITTGFDASHFRPSQKVTREQMAVFLYRLASKPVIPQIDMPFSDCQSLSDEAKSAVQWVYNESIVSGYTDTIFMPKKAITREQMAQLLKKYADVMRLSPFIKSETGPYVENFFNTNLKRADITSFEFINTIPNCQNPIDLTDSTLTSGAILACINGTEVQVGQAGGVIANPDSSMALFRNFKNPNLAKFDISNFDAFNTESLRAAFSEFKVNFDLNLPTNFGTRTTNMNYIFHFMRIDGKINFCKNFGKNALEAQYAFYFARTSGDLVFPDKFCSKVTKMSYFFGYFNNNNDAPLPLGKIVFNAGFGVSGINISYFLYEAEVDSISAFPAGFGEKVEDASNLIYSSEIKNSGIIIPDNFAINLKYSYNVFAYNTINGDIIIGKNSFQNLILQVVTYFDSDNVTGSII